MPEAAERIELSVPLDDDFGGVIRLVAGGIAEQASFGFEAMDDLQLALERLLAETGEQDRVEIAFELNDGAVRARVGPVAEGRIGHLLSSPDGETGTLGLRRVLTAVVDSFGVEPAGDGQIVVRLEKLGTPRP